MPPSLALAEELRVAVARLSRRLRRERSDQSLTTHHYAALGSIQLLEEPTLARVAACEGVTPPSMLKTLAALEEHDYIAREPHPSDGRMQIIRITEAGQRMIDDTREQRNRALADALDAFTDDERATLAKAAGLLRRLADA